MAKKGRKSKKASKKATDANTLDVLAKRDEGLTTQEIKALDDAVKFVNKRVDTFSSSLIEVGEYLLKNFFDGDIEKAHDRAPRKGISLRKLADHPDINMTYVALSRAVNLAVQENLLGSVSTLKQLTPSHRLLLLKVDDLKEKKKYISIIEKNGLSVRRFDELLIQDGYSKPRGLAAIESEKQRKLLRSGFQQFINPFESILSMNLNALFEMPKANVRSTYETAKKARERLDKIINDLESQLK